MTAPVVPGTEAASPPWRDPSRPVADRVADLLGRMTLAEKLAQLGSVWVGGADDGGDGFAPMQHEFSAELPPLDDLIQDGMGQLTRVLALVRSRRPRACSRWPNCSSDTKTPKSRRTLSLPQRAAAASGLTRSARPSNAKPLASTGRNTAWCSAARTAPLTKDALNWQFGKITRRAGTGHWHAHESRHTAVSIMSNNGVP